MDVEQRHDTQRHILRAELIDVHDVPQRGHQMAVTERDTLCATGRATGVQDQRDVIRAKRTRSADRAGASLRRKRDRSLIVEGTRHDRCLGIRRCPSLRRAGRLGHNHDSCPGILEIEREFRLRERGIQRHRRAGHGRGQQRDDHLRSVRQDDGHGVALLDTDAGELLAEARDLRAQHSVGDRGPAGHLHRGPASRNLLKQIKESRGVHQSCHRAAAQACRLGRQIVLASVVARR